MRDVRVWRAGDKGESVAWSFFAISANVGEALIFSNIGLVKLVWCSQTSLDFFPRQYGVLNQSQGQLRIFQNCFAGTRPIFDGRLRLVFSNCFLIR